MRFIKKWIDKILTNLEQMMVNKFGNLSDYAHTTVNGVEVFPPVVVTTMLPGPAGALPGTDVTIDVALPVVTVAATPPMVTVAPLRPVPVMVTMLPAEPKLGVTRVITGAAATDPEETVNADVARPTVVVATMKPKPTIALFGTVVLI